MCTILDGARSALAESELPLKYWADAVQTIIYVRNLVPSSRQHSLIPAELWYNQCQDVSHLRPFGTTAYAHVPGDLNLSKLYPRSVKTCLLGYFRHEGYKLLERETGTTFRSRDVIFEEGTTNFATQPTPMYFDYDNDPFPSKCDLQLSNTKLQQHTQNQDNNSLSQTNMTRQEIAPRLLPPTELHKNATNTDSSHEELTEDGPLAIRRACREPKPSTRLKELHEYLSRPQTFLTDTEAWIPKSYNEAMRRPDLWWEPMVQEFEMLKE